MNVGRFTEPHKFLNFLILVIYACDVFDGLPQWDRILDWKPKAIQSIVRNPNNFVSNYLDWLKLWDLACIDIKLAKVKPNKL